MMFDFPDVVDPEPVGELDLLERLLIKPQLGILVPRLRQLMLVKQSEFHFLVPSVIFACSVPLMTVVGAKIASYPL
jgi:hypothetical protein